MPPRGPCSLPLAALTAAALAAGAAAAPRTCFDIFETMCIEHEIDATAGTVTFNATCTQALFQDPGWCAFGLSLSGSSSMGNAEVFWISLLSTGQVSVEDRFNPKGHDSPVCVQQVSKGAGAVDGATGALTATWTRPLNVSGTGLAPIASGQSFHAISAWAGRKSQQATACAAGWPEHSATGSATLKF